MSFSNVPAKAEVMGWNPQTLADYMRRLKFSGCDRVVMKSSINGAQFMHMTEFDLQVFPCLYRPIITKIQSEINREENKKASGHKLRALMFPKQGKVFVQQEEVLESDESDSDSDDTVYEGPDQEAEENSSCTADVQQYSDRTDEGKHKLSAARDPVKPPRPPRGPKLLGCKDPAPDPTLTQRTSKPPLPTSPRGNHILERLLKPPVGPHIDRSKKPEEPRLSQKDIPKLKGSAVKDAGSNLHHPTVPKPTEASNRASKLTPDQSAITQSTEECNFIPRPRKGLGRSWYGGKVTRHQAEIALREVNKDGAFVVRDSSKGSVEHPFTLMLLYQGKVYNIKIRFQGNTYSLGSGFKNTQSFPGVKEMIAHHTHTPLRLIDATDQTSEEQLQSCLLHPAAL
ncbi:lymphocyte cytosolic protein 2 [Archocentrus centrarchus]|uniref:lymphocyte cytosolic protein 2 n=1 Tax=Archocentrus centrarchus TaxID=63155 RepID=UPI0011E9EA14|nr:lymphocyte cytosolic protein 2-like [Archocentrus centrarchus]